MLNKLQRKVAGKILVMTDEKDFHLTKHHNHRNDRTLAENAKAVDPVNRFQGCPKFPKKAMFLGYLGSNGKAFPGIWLEGRVTATRYKDILARHFIPTLNSTYNVGNWIWIQDGASSYTANAVLRYLESKLGSKGFWSKGVWPSNSCNLNPLDYSVWNHIDRHANNVYHTNLDDIKAAV